MPIGKNLEEDDLLAVRRPSRQESRIRVRCKLQPVAAIHFAAPQIAFRISDVGDPLFVFRESRELCRNAPKERLEMSGLQVVPRQLTTESLTDDEQFFAVFAGKKRL